MPSNESFGCFVSSTAVRTASRDDDIKRLCFMTTASGDFRGQPLTPDGQMENMEGVLTMGHKTNKYMSYPLKRVPNFGRDFCNYSFDFRKKPFGDNALNHHTCQQLREYGTAGNIVTAKLPFSKTQYAAEFVARDEDAMKKAKGRSQEPPHRYCEDVRLLTTKSFSQFTHSVPSPEVRSKGQLLRPSSSLVRPQNHWEDAMRTTYGGDFMKRAGKESRRRRKPSSSLSEPSLLSAAASTF
uniref:Uncharacterized protein n=1 Tax=Alexandrium catenella TaxID=2925 RepID=A0A7S1QJN6_ALECA|mmetsp:Transcript_33551/g.90806  ORF Transcript_33551/g.90806 Transcript_33551/m.90806 type:complete len:240 (+) Transcript_33551:123-842(+)